MKRFVLVCITLSFVVLTVIANTKFEDALKNCSSYYESGVVETEGLQIQSTKQISGWENNKCKYVESVNFAGVNSTTTCKFTKPQINEIVSVMKAYDLVHKYSNEQVDTSTLSATQNNPVVKVWQKYFQDSSVCTISGLE